MDSEREVNTKQMKVIEIIKSEFKVFRVIKILRTGKENEKGLSERPNAERLTN